LWGGESVVGVKKWSGADDVPEKGKEGTRLGGECSTSVPT